MQIIIVLTSILFVLALATLIFLLRIKNKNKSQAAPAAQAAAPAGAVPAPTGAENPAAGVNLGEVANQLGGAGLAAATPPVADANGLPANNLATNQPDLTNINPVAAATPDWGANLAQPNAVAQPEPVNTSPLGDLNQAGASLDLGAAAPSTPEPALGNKLGLAATPAAPAQPEPVNLGDTPTNDNPFLNQINGNDDLAVSPVAAPASPEPAAETPENNLGFNPELTSVTPQAPAENTGVNQLDSTQTLDFGAAQPMANDSVAPVAAPEMTEIPESASTEAPQPAVDELAPSTNPIDNLMPEATPAAAPEPVADAMPATQTAPDMQAAPAVNNDMGLPAMDATEPNTDAAMPATPMEMPETNPDAGLDQDLNLGGGGMMDSLESSPMTTPIGSDSPAPEAAAPAPTSNLGQDLGLEVPPMPNSVADIGANSGSSAPDMTTTPTDSLPNIPADGLPEIPASTPIDMATNLGDTAATIPTEMPTPPAAPDMTTAPSNSLPNTPATPADGLPEMPSDQNQTTAPSMPTNDFAATNPVAAPAQDMGMPQEPVAMPEQPATPAQSTATPEQPAVPEPAVTAAMPQNTNMAMPEMSTNQAPAMEPAAPQMAANPMPGMEPVPAVAASVPPVTPAPTASQPAAPQQAAAQPEPHQEIGLPPI